MASLRALLAFLQRPPLPLSAHPSLPKNTLSHRPLTPSLRPPSRLTPRLTPRAALKPNNLFGKSPPLPSRTILIFGGASTLGVEVARSFQAANWRVISMDFYDASVTACGVNGCPLPSDPRSPISLALPAGAPMAMQLRVARDCLARANVDEVHMCVNCTLGYVMGGIGSEGFFDGCEYVYHTSVQSSLVCARLAGGLLAEGGCLAMLGSKAALTPQPGMLGFSMAKAAVHQLVSSLSLAVGGELRDNVCVLALVPEVLDTPLHRSLGGGQAQPNWTPCDVIARKLVSWGDKPESRPSNGTFVSISSSVDDGEGKQHQFRVIETPPPLVQRTTL